MSSNKLHYLRLVKEEVVEASVPEPKLITVDDIPRSVQVCRNFQLLKQLIDIDDIPKE